MYGTVPFFLKTGMDVNWMLLEIKCTGEHLCCGGRKRLLLIVFLPEGLLCSRLTVWTQVKHVWISVRVRVRPSVCLCVWCNASDWDCRIAGSSTCDLQKEWVLKFLKRSCKDVFWVLEMRETIADVTSFWCSCKGVFRVLGSVLEMRADDCRYWYQDCRIARSRLQDCKIIYVRSFKRLSFEFFSGFL